MSCIKMTKSLCHTVREISSRQSLKPLQVEPQATARETQKGREGGPAARAAEGWRYVIVIVLCGLDFSKRNPT